MAADRHRQRPGIPSATWWWVPSVADPRDWSLEDELMLLAPSEAVCQGMLVAGHRRLLVARLDCKPKRNRSDFLASAGRECMDQVAPQRNLDCHAVASLSC